MGVSMTTILAAWFMVHLPTLTEADAVSLAQAMLEGFTVEFRDGR